MNLFHFSFFNTIIQEDNLQLILNMFGEEINEINSSVEQLLQNLKAGQRANDNKQSPDLDLLFHHDPLQLYSFNINEQEQDSSCEQYLKNLGILQRTNDDNKQSFDLFSLSHQQPLQLLLEKIDYPNQVRNKNLENSGHMECSIQNNVSNNSKQDRSKIAKKEKPRRTFSQNLIKKLYTIAEQILKEMNIKIEDYERQCNSPQKHSYQYFIFILSIASNQGLFKKFKNNFFDKLKTFRMKQEEEKGFIVLKNRLVSTVNKFSMQDPENSLLQLYKTKKKVPQLSWLVQFGKTKQKAMFEQL